MANSEMVLIMDSMSPDELASEIFQVRDFGETMEIVNAIWRKFHEMTGQHCAHDMPSVKAVDDAAYCTTCGERVEVDGKMEG